MADEQLSQEEQQQFANLIGRIFSDEQFAQQLESNPEQALQQAGFQLNETQRQALASSQAEMTAASAGDVQVAAFVRPVVSVITKGTRPAVSVITKGTRPVVSVAVSSSAVAAASEQGAAASGQGAAASGQGAAAAKPGDKPDEKR